MAFSSSSGPLTAAPNVTPLIDVLLVLLIIFMVTVPVNSRGLASFVSAATSPARPRSVDAPLIVEVTAPVAAGGRIGYRLNDQALDLQQLQETLLAARSRSESRPVFVSGDPRLDYGMVVAAISAVHSAGFGSIGLLPARRR